LFPPVLPLMVLLVMMTAPPRLKRPPPAPAAVLPLMAMLSNVSVPPLTSTPPAVPAIVPPVTFPLVIVMPEIVSIPLVVKRRKLGVPPAVLLLTVKTFAPGPWIVMSVVMLGNAVKRVIVYGPGDAKTVGSKVIVSAPASAFAALI